LVTLVQDKIGVSQSSSTIPLVLGLHGWFGFWKSSFVTWIFVYATPLRYKKLESSVNEKQRWN